MPRLHGPHRRRHRTLLTLGLALGLAVPAAAAHAQLHVAVRVSPVADLAHQMDCVAGVLDECGRADYLALWRERFLRDGADTAAIRQWRALRQRYGGGVQVDTGTYDAAGHQHRWVNLGERWRMAGLQARSFGDYHERLALVLLPPDRPRVMAAMEHFRPRFQAWWDAESRDRLTTARDSLERLLAGAELRALLGGARRFFGVEGVDTLTLTLVARPGMVRGRTNAQALSGWSLQELLPGVAPEREIGVTLHEMAHVLFSMAPEADRRAIAASLSSGGMRGRAVRGLLDEGLASALGNGLVERALRPADSWAAYQAKPLSFYDDSLVDMTGKALLPALDSLLKAGATLREPATLAALQGAMEARMGTRLTSPRALLKDLWGFIDGGLAEPRGVIAPIQQALRPGTWSLSIDSAGGMPTEVLARDPWTGALVIAPATSLARLAEKGAFRREDAAAMRRAAATGPVLFGARRANGARTWVVVARSSAEAGPLLERLGALDHDRDGVVQAPRVADGRN